MDTAEHMEDYIKRFDNMALLQNRKRLDIFAFYDAKALWMIMFFIS